MRTTLRKTSAKRRIAYDATHAEKLGKMIDEVDKFEIIKASEVEKDE